VIIVDTGRVEQRLIECPGPVSEDVIADLRARLIAALAGKPFSAVADAVRGFEDAFPPADRPLVRVVLGGTAHLARYGEEFPIAIQPVLEALEEQVVLLRLLGEASHPQGVTVRIGHENPVEGLEATSVITAQYARGDQPVASLGVVGPTHMDYPGTMAAVHAVARYVSRILDEQ
jgi:heat-inducible transcriptional repressor